MVQHGDHPDRVSYPCIDCLPRKGDHGHVAVRGILIVQGQGDPQVVKEQLLFILPFHERSQFLCDTFHCHGFRSGRRRSVGCICRHDRGDGHGFRRHFEADVIVLSFEPHPVRTGLDRDILQDLSFHRDDREYRCFPGRDPERDPSVIRCAPLEFHRVGVPEIRPVIQIEEILTGLAVI